MNKEHALAFIQALNLAQPYVPPVIFASIVNNPLTRTLEAVAKGLIELDPKTAAFHAGTLETADQ